MKISNRVIFWVVAGMALSLFSSVYIRLFLLPKFMAIYEDLAVEIPWPMFVKLMLFNPIGWLIFFAVAASFAIALIFSGRKVVCSLVLSYATLFILDASILYSMYAPFWSIIAGI